MSDDEDVPKLSAEAFTALQEFYKEQENEFREKGDVNIEENWQLSQFWYDDATTDKLVEIALKTIQPNGKVALISCPTLYKKMKHSIGGDQEVSLFEYDRRFSIYEDDYFFYDYNLPLEVPQEKANYYDLVIADPPFLSEECLSKTALTVKYLTKQNMILCTGAIMENLAQKLLGLKKSSFIPRHKNNLCNEFWCYSNFDLDKLL